jgi:hypothetical protein
MNQTVERGRAMSDLARGIAFATIFATATAATPAPRSTPTTAPSPQKSESFLSVVLRVLGVSHDPSSLKGPGDEVVTGQLWIADLNSKSTRKLTSSGGYRSPVFVPGSSDVVALKGHDIVRVKASDGSESVLLPASSITKLVGFRDDDPDALLVLVGDGQLRPGMLSLKSGSIEVLPYDAASSRDREMLAHLAGWERDYGDKNVYVKRQSKETVSGTVEWSDVFLKTGDQEPVDISQCEGIDCGQPSLSSAGNSIVFVRSQGED